jgi:hypothetical protein
MEKSRIFIPKPLVAPGRYMIVIAENTLTEIIRKYVFFAHKNSNQKLENWNVKSRNLNVGF